MRAILALLLIIVVQSWHSHAIILQIALNQLDSQKSSIIQHQLSSLQQNHLNLTDIYSAACWADEIKKTKEFQFTWKWHVINFEQFNDLLNQSDKTIREENVLDQVYDLLCIPIYIHLINRMFLMNLRFLVHIAADLHQPFHTNTIQNYGSKIALFYQNHQENLHFFTDRVADAIENPFKLPFSPTIIHYIHQQSHSISTLCEMNEQSVSFHLLYEWVKQSNEVSWRIIHLIQKRKQKNIQDIEQSFEQSLDEETVKEIQDLLLYQMCIAGKHLALLFNQLPTTSSKNNHIGGFLVLCVILWMIFRFLKQKQNNYSEEGKALLDSGVCSRISTRTFKTVVTS